MIKIKRKPGSGKGSALSLIAALMLCSAALRFGAASAPAIARQLDKAPSPPSSNAAPESKSSTSRVVAPAELQQLLSALQKRKGALDRRETEMEDRAKALEIADAAIQKRLLTLAKAEDHLKSTLALATGASENDLTRLTDVYQKMKPKDSALLFEQMDPEFAAGFLSRMKPESAAGIMAGMKPQSAYAISVIMAGRNARVPKK